MNTNDKNGPTENHETVAPEDSDTSTCEDRPPHASDDSTNPPDAGASSSEGTASPPSGPPGSTYIGRRTLRLSDVRVENRIRAVTKDAIERLEATIEPARQPMQPPGVDDTGRVIYGACRTECMRARGYERASFDVWRCSSPAVALLMEARENVGRADLSVLVRGEFLAAERGALSALKAEGVEVDSVGALVEERAAERNASPRTIYNELSIGSLPSPVREVLRDTPVANETRKLLELTKLARPDEQLAVAGALARGDAASVEDAMRLLTPAKSARPAVQAEDQVATTSGTRGVDTDAGGERPARPVEPTPRSSTRTDPTPSAAGAVRVDSSRSSSAEAAPESEGSPTFDSAPLFERVREAVDSLPDELRVLVCVGPVQHPEPRRCADCDGTSFWTTTRVPTVRCTRCAPSSEKSIILLDSSNVSGVVPLLVVAIDCDSGLPEASEPGTVLVTAWRRRDASGCVRKGVAPGAPVLVVKPDADSAPATVLPIDATSDEIAGALLPLLEQAKAS